MKQFKKSFMFFLTLIALTVSAIGVTPARAASLTVTTLVDELNANGNCSLREAIQSANTNTAVDNCITGSGADTITFSVNGIIILVGSQLPNITAAGGALTMDGTGQTVTISGNNAVRVMQVDIGASLTLNNLTIANGIATGDYGGGVYNQGTATITNSTFSTNSANSGFGGGIYNGSGSTLTITNSTFSANSTNSGFGGGIYTNGGTLAITNTTFSANSANLGAGGAIYNNGVAGGVILRNTIVANSVGAGNCGGAITNGGNNIDSAATCGWTSTNGSMSSTDSLLGALANNGGSTQTFALLTGSPAIDGLTFSAPNSAPSTDQRGVVRPQGVRYDIGSYELDTTPPTVAMTSLASDPTNASPIPVTVQFSETVTGFLAGDITPGNGSVGNFVAVDGDTYTFNLIPSTQGLVTADIAAGVASDSAGNANTAATQFSRTYTVTTVYNLFLPLILR